MVWWAGTAKLGSNLGFATFELSNLEETTPLSLPLGINGNNDLYLTGVLC